MDPVLGSRHHQWRWSRHWLSELQREGCKPEHIAYRDLAWRRRASQQPPPRSAFGKVQGEVVRAGHRVGLPAAARVLRSGEDRIRGLITSRGDSYLRALRADARRI